MKIKFENLNLFYALKAERRLICLEKERKKVDEKLRKEKEMVR